MLSPILTSKLPDPLKYLIFHNWRVKEYLSYMQTPLRLDLDECPSLIMTSVSDDLKHEQINNHFDNPANEIKL